MCLYVCARACLCVGVGVCVFVCVFYILCIRLSCLDVEPSRVRGCLCRKAFECMYEIIVSTDSSFLSSS